MGVLGRLKHGWNAFLNRDDSYSLHAGGYGASYGIRPDRVRLRMGNERSIVSSIYNKLAIDVSAVDFRHVRLDDNGRYLEDMNSGLNNCLTVEANIDQAPGAFLQDAALTMFDKGHIAIVPVDVSLDPANTAGYDIQTLRIGEVVKWMPRHVLVDLYNDETGRHEQVTLPKSFVGIVENPFYSVMNETNSTLQRLIRKLNLLDSVDEQSASGKLDLIIQLPYVVKTETKRQQANQRRADIEDQLKGSKYGIAYTDGTEKITQLNRPAENNLMAQVEFLTEMLYGQLGLTPEVMNGTADEKTMLNYNNRTIRTIVEALAQEMRRKFLTKTARSQKQSVEYFRNPFELMPIAQIAEIADKFTRNEIASSNDMRQVIGWKPSKDPKADELRNSNIAYPMGGPPSIVPGEVIQNDTSAADTFAGVNSVLDDVFAELGVPPDASN